MTTITGNGALDALNKGATATKDRTQLDQSSFLKLMTTQLKTQDPFAPVDNTQMVAQMAQFSSVAGISEMNASLKTIKADIAASRVGDASNWIGRSALIKTDVATPLSNGAYAGRVTLPEEAAGVSIALVDANGRLVHTEALGAKGAGDIDFAWDGKGPDGQPAAGGPLMLQVTARNAAGQAITPTTAAWTPISAVQSPASGTSRLVTPLGLVDPAAAIALS